MLIDTRALAKRLGCSTGHLTGTLRHRAGFPKPVQAFQSPLKWRSEDIDEYDGGV